MHTAFGKFMDFQGGQYGLAILSRFPIQSCEPLDLPEGNEPRIALLAKVILPDGRLLNVINIHFDWVRDDSFRFAQAMRLTEHLDALSGPCLLIGDFNDQPGSRTLNLFAGRMLSADKPAGDRFTFSSTDPSREIDFVFAAPPEAWQVSEVKVIDQPLASDHRPVSAKLQWLGNR
jgi:endonuclease/exonuclease/phosphatase family metal-dependent hydrolase